MGQKTQGKGVLIYIYRKRVRNSAVSGTSLEMKELCDWLYRGEFPEHYVGSEPSRKAQSIGICRSEWCAQAGMTEAEMDCVGVATKDRWRD